MVGASWLASVSQLSRHGPQQIGQRDWQIENQRSLGEVPFARMARYGISYRNAVVGVTDDMLRPKRKGVLGFGQQSSTDPVNPLVYVGSALVAFGAIYLMFLGAVL